jgi:hypothetical protein
MRARITLSVATIALGAVVMSAPAFAQTYSNMQKNGAPLSPNGLASRRQLLRRTERWGRGLPRTGHDGYARSVFERSEKRSAAFAERPCGRCQLIRRTGCDGRGLHRTGHEGHPCSVFQCEGERAPAFAERPCRRCQLNGRPRLSGQLSAPIRSDTTARFGGTQTGLFYSCFFIRLSTAACAC